MSKPHVNDRVRDLVEPILAPVAIELVDVEVSLRLVRVAVDRAGGIDIDGVSEATRLISAALDENEAVLGSVGSGGQYVLEVSSPGVERPLRTPEHFKRFVGEPVAVRTRAGTAGDRRIEGTLETADDDGITVDGRGLAYGDIDRAHIRFVWPEAGQPRRKAGTSR